MYQTLQGHGWYKATPLAHDLSQDPCRFFFVLILQPLITKMAAGSST